MRKHGLQATLMLAALAAAPAPCVAEPIAVTGGFLQVHTRINEGFFTFEGDDFFLKISFDGIFGRFGLECDGCAPGTPVELGSDFRISQGQGSAVVGGTTYPRIWIDGMTVSFQSPTVPITGAASTQLTLPFTFHGMVQFFTINPFLEPSDPVFTATLAGSGRASAFFEYQASIGVFHAVPELRYDFGEADPVPEPATLLLCGFGMGALGMIRRRKLAHAPSPRTSEGDARSRAVTFD